MYPDPIIEVSEKIYECFEEDLFEAMNVSKKCNKDIAIDTICEFMLPKFVDGEELLLTEEEIPTLFRKCLTDLTISSLKGKGLVDIIENENGDEIIFLTENGKEVAKDIKK